MSHADRVAPVDGKLFTSIWRSGSGSVVTRLIEALAGATPRGATMEPTINFIIDPSGALQVRYSVSN
jgi:hypothetical protein